MSNQKKVWFLNVMISFFFACLSLHLTYNKLSASIFISPQSSNEQAFGSFAIWTSIIILAFNALSQIYGETKGQNSDTYRCIKNVINNTVLHTSILLGFFLFSYEDLVKKQLVTYILEYFLIGRLMFSIGYLFGTMAGHQSFRAYGFGITFALEVLVLRECIGL